MSKPATVGVTDLKVSPLRRPCLVINPSRRIVRGPWISWRRNIPRGRTVKASRIGVTDGVIFYIEVEVDTAVESDWVFTQESPDLGIVISGSVVREACLSVPLSSGEGVAIARAELEVSEGVVATGRQHRAGRTGGLHDAAETVRVEVGEGSRAVLLGER